MCIWEERKQGRFSPVTSPCTEEAQRHARCRENLIREGGEMQRTKRVACMLSTTLQGCDGRVLRDISEKSALRRSPRFAPHKRTQTASAIHTGRKKSSTFCAGVRSKNSYEAFEGKMPKANVSCSLPACLPACQLASQPASKQASKHPCLPACLRAHLPACVPP
eukprot:409323-Pleurochrysis_carterae.AAC.1